MLIAGTGMVVACSAAPSNDPSTTAPTSAPTPTMSNADGRVLTVSGDECVNASGYVYAQRGDLSLGPFMSDALSLPAGYSEAKLWVASQRDGRDEAKLTILRLDGSTEQQSRPSGEAFVDNARQFYPGTIRVQPAGAYRIDVRVGPDHICVVAGFTLSR
ncbi:MAG: hypothetical protein M3171_14910 [Actinomycetota bacterium]|nr:hypothetical protein [Actinomycetota bacterium]